MSLRHDWSQPPGQGAFWDCDGCPATARAPHPSHPAEPQLDGWLVAAEFKQGLPCAECVRHFCPACVRRIRWPRRQ